MKNAGLQQEQEQWQRRGPSPSPSSYAPCHSICISAWVPFGVSACVSLCVGGLCFVCAAVLTVRCLGRWVSEDHSKEADLKTRQCVHKSLSNSQSILILLRIFFLTAKPHPCVTTLWSIWNGWAGCVGITAFFQSCEIMMDSISFQFMQLKDGD